jgi:hypothetical protein
LPFGLSLAPAVFQRLMNEIFNDLLYKGVVIYLDDILIYANNVKKHNELLDEVCKRIRDSGLRINPNKCIFGVKRLEYLGHTISDKGLETNDKKVQDIKNAKVPKTVKQLRAFLGLASYYRKFIKNYAEITSPLHAAINTEKNKLIWNSECDERFNLIKDLLCKAPVLRYPNFDKEFILDVDASFNSIGGILSQLDNNGNEHPIAYASRVLSSHEKGYCITRKELLALMNL